MLQCVRPRSPISACGRSCGWWAIPNAFSLLIEIARLLEGGAALVECFRLKGGACVIALECRLKGRLKTAREALLWAPHRGVPETKLFAQANSGKRIAS